MPASGGQRAMRRVLLAGVLAAAVFAASSALGAYGGHDERESTAGNPCFKPEKKKLRCPNLKMGRPKDLYIQKAGHKRFLHAESFVNSRGIGPVEIHGRRIGNSHRMKVKQRIYKRGDGWISLKTTGRLALYPIPGQGNYWKFRDAARFEIWAVTGNKHLQRRVRTGPKFYYCLRDLKRTHPSHRSPRHFHYPHCSQNGNRRYVTLGTSTGWSDIYPASYHEQYVNVTGLRGCFAMVHIADPKNHIRESNERDNRSRRFVSLPSGHVKHHC